MLITLACAILVLLAPAPAGAAVFTVTKTADTADGNCDADCSLREAIIAANDANGPDVVELRDLGGGLDLYRLTLLGPLEDGCLTGDLDIRDDLLIDGRGANEKIIQAGRTATSGIDRVFDVIGSPRGIAVRFESLVIENGAPTVLDPNDLPLPPDPNDPDTGRLANLMNAGGGIASRASNGRADVELVDCVVRDSRAIGANGGGIHVGSPPPVPLPSDPNETDPNAPIEFQQPSTLTLEGSMVESNVADLGGGGIYCGNCVLTLSGSTILRNVALFRDELGYGGGGIRSTGVNVAEIGRSALVSNGTDGDGGGLLVGGTGLTVITGSTLEDNDTLGGGGGLAIERVLAGGDLVVERSTLRRNLSAGDGGGVLVGSDAAVVLTETTLEANSAGLTGGGLAIDPLGIPPADPNDVPSVELTRCRIFGNLALVGPQENGVASFGPPVLAEDCWWGCNLAPLPGPVTGCDGITPATVDADPQILLSLDAAPGTILVGHVSSLTADVSENSAGAVIGTSALEGVRVAFDGVLGSAAPVNDLVSGALARSVFTGTGLGTAIVSATLDNATVEEQIEIVGDCGQLGGDSDGDGVCDQGGPAPCNGGNTLTCADNCPFVANPGQEDAGGIGAGPPDGVGDVCQCGDLDDSGIVDQADVRVFRVALADPSIPLPAGAARKCSVIGAADECGLLDVTVMRRGIEGPDLAPGIAQVCAATQP